MVTINKYNKITIDNEIYIKVFSDVTVSYLTVSADAVLKNTNNKTAFTELRRVFGNVLRLKSKKGLSLST